MHACGEGCWSSSSCIDEAEDEWCGLSQDLSACDVDYATRIMEGCTIEALRTTNAVAAQKVHKLCKQKPHTYNDTTAIATTAVTTASCSRDHEHDDDDSEIEEAIVGSGDHDGNVGHCFSYYR
eukprot:CAMPEP_0197517920 /NCGR_PEP_ID=MMETSP1318-20131121/3005_1 /TAXON_ID=552666 /ORGANISM="Partenskyella glossopodia, Strain RCC365" /LENGTH=122 /DNA_ID=CAMNT_0043067861 /DNA_START=1034 /DNA_END=1402 /DNA_ORIENTATION=-